MYSFGAGRRRSRRTQKRHCQISSGLYSRNDLEVVLNNAPQQVSRRPVRHTHARHRLRRNHHRPPPPVTTIGVLLFIYCGRGQIPDTTTIIIIIIHIIINLRGCVRATFTARVKRATSTVASFWYILFHYYVFRYSPD